MRISQPYHIIGNPPQGENNDCKDSRGRNRGRLVPGVWWDRTGGSGGRFNKSAKGVWILFRARKVIKVLEQESDMM